MFGGHLPYRLALGLMTYSFVLTQRSDGTWDVLDGSKASWNGSHTGSLKFQVYFVLFQHSLLSQFPFFT